MAPAHGYRIFGLNVRSAVEVPHWPAGAPPWDVQIVRGSVPEELPGTQALWEGAFQGERGRCLVNHPSLGRFLIERGERMTVEPAPKAAPVRFNHLLGAAVFAAVLYQRGVLCLHASAVAWRGRAYLVMGPSGAGKSTTASAMLARGAEFLTDDIAAVTGGPNGEFFIAPAFPSMRLREDSHREIAGRIEAHGALDPMDRKIRLHYKGAVASTSVPVFRICFLEYDETISRPRAEMMKGQERLGALHRNLYRRLMGRVVADPARLAEMTIALAQRVEVLRITRPKRVLAIEEIAELVLG